MECGTAGVPENKRPMPRHDRFGSIVQAVLQIACMLLVTGCLTRVF